MAFVVERIPEEAYKGLLSEHRLYQGENGAVLTQKWAIDREQDAVLALTGRIGGPYEGTQLTKFYSLYWNGFQVPLAADPLKTEFTEKGAVMNWRIRAIRIPEPLEKQRERVLDLICGAFCAVGEVFDGDRYADVVVRFDLSSAN